MARAVALIDAEPLDSDDLGEALAQMVAIGGAPKRLAEYIFSRIDATPSARSARWNDAMHALYALKSGSGRDKARATADALLRYSTTRWLFEQKMPAAPLIHGEEGRLLFTIMKCGGAVGFEAIRKIVRGYVEPLSITRASAQNSNHLNEEVA